MEKELNISNFEFNLLQPKTNISTRGRKKQRKTN